MAHHSIHLEYRENEKVSDILPTATTLPFSAQTLERALRKGWSKHIRRALETARAWADRERQGCFSPASGKSLAAWRQISTAALSPRCRLSCIWLAVGWLCPAVSPQLRSSAVTQAAGLAVSALRLSSASWRVGHPPGDQGCGSCTSLCPHLSAGWCPSPFPLRTSLPHLYRSRCGHEARSGVSRTAARFLWAPAPSSAPSPPPGRPDIDGYPHPQGDHRPVPYHQAFPVSSCVSAGRPCPTWAAWRLATSCPRPGRRGCPQPCPPVPLCPCAHSEAYPSCTVTNVQFCFDVRKLMKLDVER